MERKFSKQHRINQAASSLLKKGHNPRNLKQEAGTNVSVDMGWGQLLFGHTFSSMEKLANAIRAEEEWHRDIAFYVSDPHVVLCYAPNELFLDPSHTYRIWNHNFQHSSVRKKSITIRRIGSESDAEAVNRLYALNGMVQCDMKFLLNNNTSRSRCCWIAEQTGNKRIVGTVTGVDHTETFDDPDNGSSLWCLAVDPQANVPGIGEKLVRHLLNHYFTRGRQYVDLSVMHDNKKAIALYEKLGFQRVPIFCIKRKNPINENLFIGPQIGTELNPYARIIVDEARRRGIGIEIIDSEYGYFRLQHGGRSIVCRESLTELTTSIALSLCDDKRVTHRILKNVGLKVPQQFSNEKPVQQTGDRWVVKPARGEQGAGISVDITNEQELDKAISLAKEECHDFLVEKFMPGDDLRIIVINYKVVAAATRKPPLIMGTGQHTIQELLEKYNRRRSAATGGESAVPFDDETRRCIKLCSYELDDVLPQGVEIAVRKTANLHTGGTIHDVTDQLHPVLCDAAINAAKALNIPVTGLDFIVNDVESPEYVIIEANERPGLANHEPQPTAQKFIDFLFPQTIAIV